VLRLDDTGADRFAAGTAGPNVHHSIVNCKIHHSFVVQLLAMQGLLCCDVDEAAFAVQGLLVSECVMLVSGLTTACV
jgi:hypothetical protein